jgi:hypothetical protein
MSKRYENLIEMLNEEGHIVNEFQEANESPYFTLNSENGNFYFTVTQEMDYLEIIVEIFDRQLEDYYTVENRVYKQAKSAFNFLHKLL